jgi:hypothetical protein
VSAPPTGSATFAGCRLSYPPAAGFTGIDRFGYTVTDGRGGSARASVTITVVAAPNRPPVAVDDAAATVADTAVTIDVLGNDADPDGDALAITALSAPASGSAAVVGNQVAYTPAPGFTGTDRFGYTIEDGRGGSASAIVTVTVAPAPNRPPVAVDDAASTAAGAAVTIDVLANDSDPDGDALSVTAATQPAGGTATVSGNAIVYVPAAGFAGTDRFTYTIDDGRGGTASALVTVVVAPPTNRPPVALDDDVLIGSAQPVLIDVLANDSDPDADPLAIIAVTAPAFGSAVVSGGSILYTPGANFLGLDTFSYTISDGRGGTDTAVVTITLIIP